MFKRICLYFTIKLFNDIYFHINNFTNCFYKFNGRMLNSLTSQNEIVNLVIDNDFDSIRFNHYFFNYSTCNLIQITKFITSKEF